MSTCVDHKAVFFSLYSEHLNCVLIRFCSEWMVPTDRDITVADVMLYTCHQLHGLCLKAAVLDSTIRSVVHMFGLIHHMRCKRADPKIQYPILVINHHRRVLTTGSTPVEHESHDDSVYFLLQHNKKGQSRQLLPTKRHPTGYLMACAH